MDIRISQLLQNTSLSGSDQIITNVSGPVGYITKTTTLDAVRSYITSSAVNGLNINSLSASQIISHLIPSTNETLDLGSATNKWRDLYLSGSTIYLGTAQISVVGNNLSVDGNVVVTASTNGQTNLEYVTASNITGSTAKFTSVTASFTGSGAGLTNIPNAALTNSSVTIGTTNLSLGGTLTTLQGLSVLTGSTITGSTALFANVTATSIGVGTTAPNHSLDVTGTLGVSGTVTLATALGVGSGGTGRNTLTANNVILGNGTSAVSFVAPGTSGNVLTSNGTTWVSQAASGGSVTKYSAAIGDGSATSIVVTHSLNTANIIVSVRENITNGYFVYPDIQYTSVNSITLTFATAPTSNQYLVNVLGL